MPLVAASQKLIKFDTKTFLSTIDGGRKIAGFPRKETIFAQGGRKIAKVAMARRLAVTLYWMWRKGWSYEQLKSSVRTRASSEQAMVCSKAPSN